MCDCYNEIVKSLVELHGHPNVEYGPGDIEFLEGVETQHQIATSGNNEVNKVLGLIRYRYRPIKVIGPPTEIKKHKTWKNSFIQPNFCPICGKKQKKP